MNAINQAEQDWRTFRDYKFSEIKILEDEDHIQLSQRGSPNQSHLFKLQITVGLLWFIPAALPFFTQYWVAGAVYGFLSLIPWMAVFGIGYLLLHRRTYVDIYPSKLTVKNANQHTTLTAEQIRNIDVQQDGTWHTVVIWHGPIALYTLSSLNYQNAISFKEGMVAAIGMLATRAPIVSAAPPRRSFPE
jgi:hypothetical protein